jgi:glycine/serine hydroxymethyltransferase
MDASGLVAAQEANNPFEYCDIVTTTTHKSMRGPRQARLLVCRTEGRPAHLFPTPWLIGNSRAQLGHDLLSQGPAQL